MQFPLRVSNTLLTFFLQIFLETLLFISYNFLYSKGENVVLPLHAVKLYKGLIERMCSAGSGPGKAIVNTCL